MKSVLFIVMLIGIILLAFYLKKKSDVKPESSDVIKPVSEWNTILEGEWKFTIKEKDDIGSMDIDQEAIFLNDKTFKLGVTARYFLNDYRVLGAYSVSGGTLSGKWNIENDSSIILSSDTCSIVESLYKQLNDEVVHFAGCDFYAKLRFGNVYDNDLHTTVNIFNSDSILITGKRFRNGANVSYEFKRIKERVLPDSP